MLTHVIKRDGTRVFCDGQKIAVAVEKAARAAHEAVEVETITTAVLIEAAQGGRSSITVEEIQDLVEASLMRGGYTETAKAYILYRDKRRTVREGQALIDATVALFDDYLDDRTWMIQENANTKKSINGMNNYIREAFTRRYWLSEVYPPAIAAAHQQGDLHIHDLGFYGAYCCGWDLEQLLTMGFGGVEGKVSSRPAKHLRSFLGQIVNATFTTQGECAGAQAWSSFDTYAAPFIRADKLEYASVKQALQEFVFNLNVPTRVGFQCPFSNLTLDLVVPERMREKPVIIAGVAQTTVYGDYQREMDMFNTAFCEVMGEGDASGRVFTFPIPTINVTKEFDWESPVVGSIMAMTAKYGIPYFSNYVNSDLNPEDALSMCCRLRLDTTELRKRGGGLFGSNPLTGSIGVVTLNLARIGYLAKSEVEFLQRLVVLSDLAAESLALKRAVIERETERGMYPFSARFLAPIKEREGAYWANHFSTIGVVGMHEALENLYGGSAGITSERGQAFALKVLEELRNHIIRYQDEYGVFFNLEATPAEGTSHRLATLDRERYPQIITSGVEVPYYTNSTQLPVGYTDDIFEALDLQDALQCAYTGGTVLHLYIGERIADPQLAKLLIKRVFEHYRLPYISLTPTFSTCTDHGYLDGEQPTCPHCGTVTEVWTRVVGYLRPVADFHQGKKEEYGERRLFKAHVS
ncbi:MAG: ribonucleoside triphosphate reductase [Sphaerochaeta sp.]|jgi:ribonucleoside-triphosphate reductase|nr:ribonucleoside triphosphate reductase [Sphaerochaeta sp.]